ncbi:hypothetical protein AB0952_09195 [Streptomyces caniferus]|uniref:hypothetical protein n=1 Tax=Streptomyces caniferus TaxID=285557 RepID=UPI00345380E2
MRPHRAANPDESAAWRAVARESVRAFDLIAMPSVYGLGATDGARRAAGHLKAGRALMQPILDRYVAGARTPAARLWRRWAVARSPYVRAFDEVLIHAQARCTCVPEPPWPQLYSRGTLPLIHRHTSDRRLLEEDPR